MLLQQIEQRMFAKKMQRAQRTAAGSRWGGCVSRGRKKGAAVFLPQQPGIHQRTLQMAGGVAGVILHVLPNLAADLIINVLTDKISQFQRPHAKVASGLERTVDLRCQRHVFFQQAKTFQIKRPRHAIDDKTRRGFADHKLFAYRRDQLLAA
ncbi:hypothetical protein D3C80_745830 [compost metagenome]